MTGRLLFFRDKLGLDVFWLQDDSLADSDNVPASDVIAAVDLSGFGVAETV